MTPAAIIADDDAAIESTPANYAFGEGLGVATMKASVRVTLLQHRNCPSW
jgi:hypothetical protein